MSSCMSLCLPPLVLWRQHRVLQRSHCNHFRLHKDCCSSFFGFLVKCLLWRCNLYILPPIKCASFRSEFTLLIFRKGKVTGLLKFLRRFKIFFPKKVSISVYWLPFVTHAISCLIADSSCKQLISQVHDEHYVSPKAEQLITWVISLLTNKTCWGVFTEPKDSTADNLLDEAFSFPSQNKVASTTWPSLGSPSVSIHPAEEIWERSTAELRVQILLRIAYFVAPTPPLTKVKASPCFRTISCSFQVWTSGFRYCQFRNVLLKIQTFS